MRKSQISLEFMFAIGVTFFIFLILLGFMFNRNIELRETEDYLEKENECWKVSNLISSVFTAGDGTVVNISVENVVHIYGDGTMAVEKKLGEESMKLGYYCCQKDECNSLGKELNDSFEVTQYIAGKCNPNECTDECDHRYCDSETCEPIINQFLSDIGQYGMVFLEDPHLDNVGTQYIGKLDSFVKDNAGIAVISEHIKHGNLFGLDLKDGIKNRDNEEYATVVDDYKYNLGIGDDIWFKQKPAIKVADVPIDTIPSFKVIANYSKRVDNSELAAIAVWSYGSGEVSYFADFEKKVGEIDLAAIVVEHVEQIVNLLSDPSDSAYCTYIDNIDIDNIASEGKFSGDILIQNIDNVVVLENV